MERFYRFIRAAGISSRPFCLFILLLLNAGCAADGGRDFALLQITDVKTQEVYVQKPVRKDSRLFFGWIHSLEKIPWNEYYSFNEKRQFVLETITFPAFGAGIPENKGSRCYIKDGLIYMDGIKQVFPEIIWLNSHTATRDIRLDDECISRGKDLPPRKRLKLSLKPINISE